MYNIHVINHAICLPIIPTAHRILSFTVFFIIGVVGSIASRIIVIIVGFVGAIGAIRRREIDRFGSPILFRILCVAGFILAIIGGVVTTLSIHSLTAGIVVGVCILSGCVSEAGIIAGIPSSAEQRKIERINHLHGHFGSKKWGTTCPACAGAGLDPQSQSRWRRCSICDGHGRV